MTSSPAKRRHGVQPLPRCDGRWPVSRHDAVAELDEDIALVQAELDAADHAAKDALARVEAGDENVTADDLPNPWDTLPPFFDQLLDALQ